MNWSGGFKNRFNRSSNNNRTAFKTASSLHQKNGIKFVERDFEKRVEKNKNDSSNHVKESSHIIETPIKQPLKEINQVEGNRNEISFKQQMKVIHQPPFSNIPCGSSSSDSDDAATDTCYSPFSSPPSTISCQDNEMIDLSKEPNPNHAVLNQSMKSELSDNYYEMGIYQGVPLVPYTPPLRSPWNSQSSSLASPKGVNVAPASHHLVNVGFSSEETSGFNSFMTPVMQQRPLSTPFHHLKAYDQQPEPMDTSTPKADPTYFTSPHNLPPTSTPSATIAQNEVDNNSLFRTPIRREQRILGQSPAYASSLVVTPSSQRKQVRFASPAEDMENQFRSKRSLYTPLPKPKDRDILLQNGNKGPSTSLPMHSSPNLIISSPDEEIVSVFPSKSKTREQKEIFPTSIEVHHTGLQQSQAREQDGTSPIFQTHQDAFQLDAIPPPSKDQEVAIPSIGHTQQVALQQDDDFRTTTDDHSPSQSNSSSSSTVRPCPAHPSRNNAHFMFHRGHRSSYNHCRCRKVKIIRTVVRTIKVRDVGTQTSP